MSTDNIAITLYDKGLIKSKFFFKIYLKLNNASSLKASTYLLSKNMTMEEIVKVLESGNSENGDVINLTFKEGQNIRDYANIIEENTSITADTFLAKVKDTNFLNQLISEYWFLTEDILNPEIYYPLEGYLFPDTYQFVKTDLTSEDIIRTLLDEEEKKLSSYKEALSNSNIHSIITLASMAE